MGLAEECVAKLGDDPEKNDSVFRKICELFEYLPLGATINDKILCIHSGIGENVKTLEDIRQIKKPYKVSNNNPVIDLLYSQPVESVDGEAYTGQNYTSEFRTKTFDGDKVSEFLKLNKIDLIIRSHDLTESGFERLYDSKVISIYSATNYCGFMNNNGGIIFVKKNLEVQPKILPYEETSSTWIKSDKISKEYPPSPKKILNK